MNIVLEAGRHIYMIGRVENDSTVKINVSHYCKINRTLITKSEGAFLAAYMLL